MCIIPKRSKTVAQKIWNRLTSYISVTVALYVLWMCSENVSESNQVALQILFSQSYNVTAQPTTCVELNSNMTDANNGLVLIGEA